MNAGDVGTMGVVGAGQMGAGIAQVAAAKGVRVLLLDASEEIASRAKAKIGAILARVVEKAKMTAPARQALLDCIVPVGTMARFAEAEFAIEAAPENPELKNKILKELDAILPKDSVLASNTSSISITKLAALTSRPDRVIGMHFMNPPPLMKLVEVVRGVQTSDATYTLVKGLAERFEKTVITSADHPGFVVNRMIIPFINEACFALQEKLATAADIDEGARLGLNHPMGPLELADLVGLDTVLAITEVFLREIGDDKYRPATLLRNLVAAGWFGRKSGRGFYVYNDRGEKTGAAF